MGILKKYKNIILILVIAVAVFWIYNNFLRGDSSDGSLLTSEGGSTSNQESVLVGKEFLTTLLELRSLDLDNSIFSSSLFNSLEDFSQEVAPQPAGRPNPFREIGNDPVVTTPPQSSGNATSSESGI